MTLRNAFDGLALEHTNSAGDAHLISGSKVKYRREYNDPTFADWDVSVGAGMTANATNGALVITTGTTANSVTTFTTKQSFTAPFKASFGVKLSQKIANVEYYVEAVAINEDGSVDETVVAAWRIAGTDSTTTTNARHEVRNGGTARIQSPNVASQATQTADSVYEIVLESDEVWFHSRVADSNVGRSSPQVRQTTSPDPNRRYKLRYRIVNAATPPASTSTFTSSHLACVDYTELAAEVTGGTGSIAAGQAIPMYGAGGSMTATVSNGTLGASATVIGTSMQKVLSAASVNNTLVKASAGRIYGWSLSNTTATWRYVKFYNKATAPVAGTDVPVSTLALPPNSTTSLHMVVPLSFATGMGYAITAGPADNDTAVVAANDVVGHIAWL